ncbi:pyridine nucleotide-disulfide oxidoreductase/dicluster-binding protein [Desulfohalovibrio reitneri]|uniref:pyridine nucleotide-disulfide oxidoreductase/dicluster-binding protein n=1 Tax=Desulfohalovibrio reitneri TaxID=1307759 RepID=UPI0004A74AFE|nr:pyridine nucleotide-disulfide oxidoreductase/dicluster-binding protein [Desulfohalovibrio reitneri]
MDQQALRELEYLCIQEEWPYCRAACPLHVDARGLCGAMAEGDLARARSILDKTMPVAGILGRICEAPCERRCKRAEAGGAIRIGNLERHCVENADRRGKALKVPDRGRRAIVVGCSLSGLTVAHDLARKGYRVEVHHQGDDPGEDLLRTLPTPVPQEVVAGELQHLGNIGVGFTRSEITAPLVEDLLGRDIPVYVGLDAVGGDVPPCATGEVDPATLTCPRDNLLLGGFTPDGTPPTAIQAAAQGRKAAASIDRLTQKVSLRADREREGPVDTRLVTSLEGVESAPPVLTGEEVGDPEAVRREAGRCLACECMICVRDCPYLDAFGAYPKSYARQIYNNESIVQGVHQANKLVNSCMLCGLCTTLCPNDFPMADLCLGSRERMTAKGAMPPSAHDFALRDLDFSRSEEFFTVRGDPGKAECAWLFFPGCQLCGASPGRVEAAYAWLREHLEGGVGLALACCGAPARWSGRREVFREAAEQLHQAARELGGPTWIMACPSCQEMLGHFDPEPSQVSLWDVLAERKAALAPAPPSVAATLVDPCTAGHMPALRETVRALVSGVLPEWSEPRLNDALAACCGYGGLLREANPGLGERAARERAEGCPGDAVTYCAMCREQLAKSGKRAAHLLDVFFPGGGDPFARPAAGISASQANRRRLKADLLASVWSEPPPKARAASSISLDIPDAVRETMERRRILDSDIQRVIAEAASHGQVFAEARSGHTLASLRVGEVTFWVGFSRAENGDHTIHTAYSHRMRIGQISTGSAS